MSNIKYQGAACLVLAFATFSSSAMSADLGGAPAPAWDPPLTSYANPATWTGMYLGLSGGYGWGQSDHTRAGDEVSTDPEGGLAALTLGYNYQMMGGLVLGLEGDVGIMDLNADDKAVFGNHSFHSEFGPWWATVRGRAGYTFDRTLIYGTGGAAFMGVDETIVGDTPADTARNRDTRSGWVVGGGIERAFAPNMSAKVEYLHMDFGTFNGITENQDAFAFDNKIDLVRAGVNYKF